MVLLRMTRSCLASLRRQSVWKTRIVLALGLCCVAGVHAQAQEKKVCSPPVDERLGSYSCQKLLDRELTAMVSTIAEGFRPGLPGLLRDDQLPKQKQLFLDAQRAWEEFRARTCEAEAYENHGTSGYGAALGNCWLTLTQARIDQLRRGRWGVVLGAAQPIDTAGAAAGG